jgi:RHS repeat-associated protein
MRFPGQRYDSVSGMSYNYFRDYDAATGRYVESDPLGLLGGLSGYPYVNSRPHVRSDEKGLMDIFPPIFCAKYPLLCKEITECAMNYFDCKKRICRAGNLIYHPICDNAACSESDTCNVINFKEGLAKACVIGRVLIKWVCFSESQDDNHDQQIKWAYLKWRGCRNLQEQRGCLNCR